MKVNYHTHCERCLHAFGVEEDYVKEAIAQNLDILGMSDHAPFPDFDYGCRMPYGEVDAYFEELRRLKAEYKNQIKLLSSLEIEYMPKYHSYYEHLLNNEVDYLLLGEHQYFLENGENHNIFFAANTEQYVEYANMVADAMKTGYFAIVAHPDLFAINKFAWDANCDKAVDIMINAALKTDTILEINANGFRREVCDFPDGERYPYPHRKLWEEVAKSNARVIVGSDAHKPELLWDKYVKMAYDFAEELGIKPVEIFKEK